MWLYKSYALTNAWYSHNHQSWFSICANESLVLFVQSIIMGKRVGYLENLHFIHYMVSSIQLLQEWKWREQVWTIYHNGKPSGIPRKSTSFTTKYLPYIYYKSEYSTHMCPKSVLFTHKGVSWAWCISTCSYNLKFIIQSLIKWEKISFFLSC